jgi:hypothetical protein
LPALQTSKDSTALTLPTFEVAAAAASCILSIIYFCFYYITTIKLFNLVLVILLL